MHCDPENRWWAAPSPSTPTFKRLLELAADHGFVLMPALYEASLGSGANTGIAEVAPDKNLGAFFVTKLAPDEIDDSAATDETWELTIRSGNRLLTQGRVRGKQTLGQMGIYSGDGQELPGPIVVKRGETLQLNVKVDTGTTIAASAAMHAYGYHARFLDGRMAGAAADELARAVMAEGELTLGGIVLTDNESNGFAVDNDVEWTHWGLTVSSGGTLSRYSARVGNVDLMPKGITVVKPFREESSLSIFQCRLPMSVGDRVDAQQAAASTFVSVLSLVGRRFTR